MRVLLVEDEHKIANSIKKGLEQESFAVDLAFEGTTGRDLALSEEYDLIILDRLLPGIDGLSICKEMREKQIHTPVLLLTAKDQLKDKVEGLNSGADDYLVKPFAFEELLARIRALIRRPKIGLGVILTAFNLSLNTLNFEVIRDDKKIDLSAKEFALLEYLLRHKGQVVTKENIINHVWDYDANILANTVEVYIRLLRNKIEKPFPDKPELIKTVRGFGYLIPNGDK